MNQRKTVGFRKMCAQYLRAEHMLCVRGVENSPCVHKLGGTGGIIDAVKCQSVALLLRPQAVEVAADTPRESGAWVQTWLDEGHGTPPQRDSVQRQGVYPGCGAACVLGGGRNGRQHNEEEREQR